MRVYSLLTAVLFLVGYTAATTCTTTSDCTTKCSGTTHLCETGYCSAGTCVNPVCAKAGTECPVSFKKKCARFVFADKNS